PVRRQGRAIHVREAGAGRPGAGPGPQRGDTADTRPLHSHGDRLMNAPTPDVVGADTPDTATTTNTVLVVDDSVIDRHLAWAIVETLPGWKARFASNGIDALAAIKQQAPDLVLTDMLMPEMDGLELVQSIRLQHPLIPVILMTAHGSEDVAIQALQRGA